MFPFAPLADKLMLETYIRLSCGVNKMSSFLETQIRIWPNVAPGSEGVDITEKVIERSKDPNVNDRAILGISEPSLIPFFPEASSRNGMAVIIAPGGAYERISLDKEGLDIASWLNGLGITAFILKYRLPAEGHRDGYLVPLQDAMRAIRVVRHRAAEWKLDPNRIGVMGFSAGGHLASTIGTHDGSPTYEPIDEADELDTKPNFLILCYAVIRTAPRLHGVPNLAPLNHFPNDERVTAQTPPTFLMHAHDDTVVPSEHSVLFYNALKKAEVDAELHIYNQGGHGFGTRTNLPIGRWTERCEQWLNTIYPGLLDEQ